MLKVLGDRVMVETTEKPTTTPGGIQLMKPLPDQNKGQSGTVIAKGSGPIADLIGVGDVVHHPEYLGVNVRVEGKLYLVVKGEDLAAVESK